MFLTYLFLSRIRILRILKNIKTFKDVLRVWNNNPLFDNLNFQIHGSEEMCNLDSRDRR